MKSIILSIILSVLNLLALATDQWPREINNSEAKITIYQPQPESFHGNDLSARAALSITKEDNPVFGAFWVDAKVDTDRENRIVTLKSLSISAVRFPGIDDSTELNRLKQIIETEVPKWDLEISLDRLLASLEMVEGEKKIAANLKTDAPEVIFKEQSSVLISIDGEPVIKDGEDEQIKRVVNSPYFIVYYVPDEHYFLYGGNMWFKTKELRGEWEFTKNAPKKVRKLAESEDVEGLEDQEKKPELIPRIVVRTQPAELIQSDGKPSFVPIQNTNLLFMKNTESHVFMDITSQQYYVLISGRWYTASGFDQDWKYVSPDELPEDFTRIPEGSDKDIVLASVPGTKASKEAVLDSQIPQTAAVSRKDASAKVEYDGEPKFEPIEGTNLYYAVNTANTVLRINNKFYVVYNAVWFESSTPFGPWEVSTERPDEVEKIPPSNPHYNVKYVYIYDSTPDVVYVGYTPGYVGAYVHHGVIVYGTGYYYRPWIGYYYYPRPVTYGYHMHYHPYYGWSMGISLTVGGPRGWVMVGSYGPTYYGWWGPRYYYPPVHVHYHHYYGPRRARPVYRQNNVNVNVNNVNVNRSNVYNNFDRGVVASRKNNGGKLLGSRDGNRNVGGALEKRNNVFSDRQGDVFKREGDKWQKWEGKDWKSTDRSGSFNKERFEQQRQGRERGANRERSFQGRQRSGNRKKN